MQLFIPKKGIHCWFLCSFFLFFLRSKRNEGDLTDRRRRSWRWRRFSSTLVILCHRQLRTIVRRMGTLWQRCGGGIQTRMATGNKNGPCRHCVFGLSRRCLSQQWLLQGLAVVVVLMVMVVVVVVEVVRIFVSHSNLYQSCVRNDGWHLSMSDIFVFHFSLKGQERVRESAPPVCAGQRNSESWRCP